MWSSEKERQGSAQSNTQSPIKTVHMQWMDGYQLMSRSNSVDVDRQEEEQRHLKGSG